SGSPEPRIRGGLRHHVSPRAIACTSSRLAARRAWRRSALLGRGSSAGPIRGHHQHGTTGGSLAVTSVRAPTHDRSTSGPQTGLSTSAVFKPPNPNEFDNAGPGQIWRGSDCTRSITIFGST